MSTANDMVGWVIAWAAAAVLISVVRTARQAGGVGLVTAFLVNFGMAYWIGAAIALLPWYDPPNVQEIFDGFRQSTFAIVSFAVGVLLLAPRRASTPEVRDAGDARLPRVYLVLGLVCFIVLVPVANRIPSGSALVSQGWNLAVAGLALGCWCAWSRARSVAFGWWLTATLCLPLLTILTQGFLGYGTTAAIAVLCLVASFYRPRWRVFAAALVLMYVGLSLYVTYMRDRNGIREIVWGGAPIAVRVNTLYQTISTLEWFNIYNPDHLARITERLDQNAQVGAAVEYLEQGLAQLAYGKTLIDGLVSLVPRAIWPSKPIVVGGAALVTQYTGIQFDPTTTVGVGNIMESYISFGTIGVVVWFVLLGAVLARVDAAAAAHLRRGEWPKFVQWYLPGLSLLAVNGSIVELTSSVGAAIVVTLAVNSLIARSRAQSSRSQRVVVRPTARQPGPVVVNGRLR
ncbi:MAG: hypothetical protein JO352_31630 [Chloroflexi bacterium]|nr:hypothetical protein [Chloroflexota bacterium]MBV9597390.1 hypothetical protein [Chloroflexota bacterium]